MLRDHRLMPMAMALAGVALLSLMDAFMKGAALASGAYSAALLRSLFGAAMIAPVWLAKGASWPPRKVMRLHLERGVVSALMALSWFYALTKLPIAEAIAISFIAPLIALYLARIMLGEQIRPQAVFASLLGFAGCLVIVGGRLDRETVDNDLLLGLASLGFSALLYAYNFIVIRRQSQVAGPVEVATFHSGIGGLVLLLAAPWLFTMPAPHALGQIAISGALTVSGALLIAWAYARAEAQDLVPFEYSGFLWGALFGWLFFREPVSGTTLAGTLLIVVSCWVATRKPQPLQTAA